MTALTPIQCRMARAAIRVTRRDLADLADVSVATLADFENEKRQPYERTLRDIRVIFERQGVTFLPRNSDGHGVRILG